VDLASSARECFVALWPRLSECGVFVTHDTAYLKVLQEFYNRDLWQNRFKEMPPILRGRIRPLQRFASPRLHGQGRTLARRVFKGADARQVIERRRGKPHGLHFSSAKR
jgi:hypothetical protein